MLSIDLNCDMGESFGVYKLGFDEEVMPLITSANVACGFHASDPLNMTRTVRLAKQWGVQVGAHPSFPDLVGFGRRTLQASPAEITADVTYQIGALLGICRAEGVPLRHVKAHGALYNLAARDYDVARAIAAAIKGVDPNLVMVCLANSTMVQAARDMGIPYRVEAFADRAYTAEGTLVPRRQPNAVLHDPEAVAQRVLRLVQEQKVKTVDGQDLTLTADTVCVHGDSPGAVEMVKAIRRVLDEHGVKVSGK